jgi:hypothetical protein
LISSKGFNSKTVLTVADSKKRTNIGSAEMRNNLKYDTDMGIELVQDVNGYVFVLDNFVGAKPPVKKQYVTVLTNVLADNISRTEVSSDCVCQLNYGLHAEEKCEAKDTKFLPPAVSSFGYESALTIFSDIYLSFAEKSSWQSRISIMRGLSM